MARNKKNKQTTPDVMDNDLQNYIIEYDDNATILNGQSVSDDYMNEGVVVNDNYDNYDNFDSNTYNNNDIYSGIDINSGIEINSETPISSGGSKNKSKSKSNKAKSNPQPKQKTKKTEEEDEDAGLTIVQKCEKYNPKCTSTMFWRITIIGVLGMIGIGFAYQLSLPYILLIAVTGYFATQKSILYVCRNKYENQKIEDVASYIEQMLYSFRRNYKILSSLEDTIDIFEEGEMRDAIQQAIDYITQSTTDGNIYEEALSIIQKKYDCRRIRSLHRFFVKVEGVGGDNELGIQALLNDRRMWLERVDEFKKEKSSVVKEIVVSCAFSSTICAVTMYMLPSHVGSMKSVVCRIASTIYILINQFTVSSTFKGTVLYLNDTYTEEEELYLLNKFRHFKTWDKKAEQKKGLKPAIMMVGVGLVGVILGYWWMLLICGAMAAFSYFVQPVMKYNSTKKTVTREIEKAYPDWLLELSLLLQTENLHVALEKTLDTAPLLLSDDLIELSDNIASYPTEVFPYTQFLRGVNVPNIHSSMKLLYSIASYGSEEEEKQIAELLERNASLMNKAEEAKNNDRLSKVYIYKFIPMGASALKLIVDMFTFIIMFISQSLGAL